MCVRSVEEDKRDLVYPPDHFKIHEMCEDAVSADSYSLKYVSDCYVKVQEMWYEDFDNDDELVECCSDYKQRNVQKHK